MRLAKWFQKIKVIDGALCLNVSDFQRSITKYVNYVEEKDVGITLLQRGKPVAILMKASTYEEACKELKEVRNE